MRLKLFIFPASVIIALVVFIQFVWPGFQDILLLREETQKRTEELAQAIQQKSNILALRSDMSKNQTSYFDVINFLPQERYDEQTVKILDGIMKFSGVALVDADVRKAGSQRQGLTNKLNDQQNLDSLGNPIVKYDLEQKEAVYSVDVFGEYESVKKFLDEVFRIHRKHVMVTASIVNPKEEKESPDSKILRASAEISFSYAPMIRVARDKAIPTFDSGSFDYSPIDAYKQQSADFELVTVPGGTGRSNIFLP